MKTQDLADYRNEEKVNLDDTIQERISRHELEQFNQVKKILANLCFIERSRKVLSPEIILDVMDEIRCERKIIMVI